MTEFILVSESELKLRKGDTKLTMGEVQELLEYGDVFTKLIDVTIHSVRADLRNLKLIGKESEAYIMIKAYDMLKKNLKSVEKPYKDQIVKIEKDKQKD